MTEIQTTGDQKSARQWLNKYGQHNLNMHVFALLKYLATNCYWQMAGTHYKIRRNFEVSHSTLAKNIYCSLRSVGKYIDEAEKLGFISVIKSGEGKRDAYALHIEQAKHYSEYKPSKSIQWAQERARREAKAASARRRRVALKESDPYAELVDYAKIVRSPYPGGARGLRAKVHKRCRGRTSRDMTPQDSEESEPKAIGEHHSKSRQEFEKRTALK